MGQPVAIDIEVLKCMQVSVYGKYMHTLHEHSMSLQYVNVTVSPAGLVTSIYPNMASLQNKIYQTL